MSPTFQKGVSLHRGLPLPPKQQETLVSCIKWKGSLRAVTIHSVRLQEVTSKGILSHTTSVTGPLVEPTIGVMPSIPLQKAYRQIQKNTVWQAESATARFM